MKGFYLLLYSTPLKDIMLSHLNMELLMVETAQPILSYFSTTLQSSNGGIKLLTNQAFYCGPSMLTYLIGTVLEFQLSFKLEY